MKLVKRVFVQSFGCRASEADGVAIAASLERAGCISSSEPGSADLIIVNTCSVTHAADRDARRAIRSLHRERPEAEILVTGCYAQRAPNELAGLAGVRWVVGNSHKAQIAEITLRAAEEYHGQVLAGEMSAQTAFAALAIKEGREDRTRPNLKVQDGCSNRCSFCIIPTVRGRSRSAPLESVLEQAKKLAEHHCEIVLTGINLGRWGRELPGRLRFVDLLHGLLRETSVRRLRISSVEPMDWSQDLLELVAHEPRMAKHVHLPLQSGSDAVLKRMYRKYRTQHYASRLEIAHRLMPDAAIGADVMTGFPGESDAEFLETVGFIEQQPFSYLHVFTYSERPGTLAAEYKDSVPMQVRRERTRILRELSDRKHLEFRRKMIGKTLSAVTLDQSGIALTTNFLKVRMAEKRPANQIVDVEIGGIAGDGLTERSLLTII